MEKNIVNDPVLGKIVKENPECFSVDSEIGENFGS